jgi:ribosomal protein S2
MAKLPGVVIIIGQPEEIHAVRECRQLGIPTITLLDSNCDPTLADWFIPANDDSVSALRVLLDLFESSILSGQTRYREQESIKIAKQNVKQSVRRKNSSIGKKASKSRSATTRLRTKQV